MREQLKARWKKAARHQRTCDTVIAGVHIFSPPGFLRQEPGCDERQRLMMVPAPPGAYFVVRQTRVAFGALDAFLDAMLGFVNAGELRQRLVPLRFPKEIGVITGIVGAAGGVGGFLLPNILGRLRFWTGSFGGGFLIFALAAAGCLCVLMLVSKTWKISLMKNSGPTIRPHADVPVQA